MNDSVCARCGLCCHYLVNERLTSDPCKFLVKLSNGRCVCRIYKNRLGKNTGRDNSCTTRAKGGWNYPGCPLNVLFPDKPMIKKMEDEKDGKENNKEI